MEAMLHTEGTKQQHKDVDWVVMPSSTLAARQLNDEDDYALSGDQGCGISHSTESN